MKPSAPTAFHRRLIGEAWSLVWQRRPLWVFGLFGGLALSGTVIEPAFSGLSRVVQLGAFWMHARMDDWATATVPVGNAISQACRLNPLASKVDVTAAVILVFLFSIFALMCEGGLIAGLAEKSPLSLPDALRRGWQHAWSLFVVGFVARAYQLILLLLIALPVLFYAEGPGTSATFAACLAILLFLPLAIGGHIVAIFASIHVVRRDANVPEAIEVALRLFFARWLEALETGVVLLVLGALAILAFGMAAGLAAVPILFLFAVVHASGWFGGMALAATVGLLAFCTALFVFAGLLSAFRIAVWLRFYERVLHPLHGPRVVAKLKRLFHPAHIGK